MSDPDWLLDDLRIIRDRFREARRDYPGLQCLLAKLPEDERCWSVAQWHRVDSFASIKDNWNSPHLSAEERPAVSFLFLRMAEACLVCATGSPILSVPAGRPF